jgi:hypothetical protein
MQPAGKYTDLPRGASGTTEPHRTQKQRSCELDER